MAKIARSNKIECIKCTARGRDKPIPHSPGVLPPTQWLCAVVLWLYIIYFYSCVRIFTCSHSLWVVYISICIFILYPHFHIKGIVQLSILWHCINHTQVYFLYSSIQVCITLYWGLLPL